MNHVPKYSKIIISVIITLETNVNGSEAVFNGMKLNAIVKIAHVLKHSLGRCGVGDFDIVVREGSICTVHKAVISLILHKSIFLQFVHHELIFMTDI